ncbi:helix-turn-helix domain-containing protein [Rhodococcus sp. 05-339-2]|uniref:excisionase family DNA-binding protein n=1 Tax=Rhodococcoides fascians TaxID=1828 RepID=UPI00050CE507|nr:MULTISPECIES: excisionase family DNA-binding protein [Rhodococcus]OZD85599.1 helix-turn-helix domain-containing protein [Rhodococcus sp. 05-339-2]
MAHLLQTDQASSRLGISRSKLFGLIQSGELPSVKVGKRRLVSDSAIDQFIEKLEAEAKRTNA